MIADPGLDDGVQCAVELLAVTVVVEPVAVGDLAAVGRVGATPASIANAASEWIRPWWDQAQSTVAATIGPTPNCSSRPGRQERTIATIALRCSAASWVSTRKRRAKDRNASTVVLVSTSQDDCTRRPAAVASIPASLADGTSHGWVRRAIARLNTCCWASGCLHRRAACRQQHRKSLAVPTTAGGNAEPVAQRLTCSTDRIEGVGLRPVASLRSFGSVERLRRRSHHARTGVGSGRHHGHRFLRSPKPARCDFPSPRLAPARPASR